MSKKFIRLHDANDNTPMLVNVDEINNVYYDPSSKHSTIVFITECDSIEVMETVDKIHDILNKE